VLFPSPSPSLSNLKEKKKSVSGNFSFLYQMGGNNFIWSRSAETTKMTLKTTSPSIVEFFSALGGEQEVLTAQHHCVS